MDKDRRKFDIIFKKQLDNILEYNKRQDKLIGDIHKIIYGNGEVDKSWIHKFAIISTTLKLHWGLFEIILGFLTKLLFFS